MRRSILYAVIVLALCSVISAFAGDNYSVSTGGQATTYKSPGGQAPPAPPPKPAPKPSPTIGPKPSPTIGGTKTIMLPTWPVQVPVRVPANTQERPDNPHAGENAGAAQGLGSGGR